MERERGRGAEGAAEHPRRRLYLELQAADAEVDRLMQELDEYLAGSADRAEAERRAVETIIPEINAARARANAALDRWLEAIEEL